MQLLRWTIGVCGAWCRARVALKRVAGWLGVPWSRCLPFETLLAHQVRFVRNTWLRLKIAEKRLLHDMGSECLDAHQLAEQGLHLGAMSAVQAAAGRQVAGVPSAGRSAATWAKIGVASVGAGALFAVTGDARACHHIGAQHRRDGLHVVEFSRKLQGGFRELQGVLRRRPLPLGWAPPSLLAAARSA